MISRIGQWKPTVPEFFAALNLAPEAQHRWWRRFRVLRRHGIGQKSAAAAVSISMDRSKVDVATALGSTPRRVWDGVEKVIKRLGLEGPCALAVFLDRTPSTFRGKRRKATPQERPFARPIRQHTEKTQEGLPATAPEARTR